MILIRRLRESLAEAVGPMARLFSIRLAVVVATALAVSVLVPAQAAQLPETGPGQIMGTVMDVNGDAVIGATVILENPETGDLRQVVTPENGFFEFDGVKPGVPYQVAISAEGFERWTSSAITVDAGGIRMLGAIQMVLATQVTTVRVSGNPGEIAIEQIKYEETQRVFGVIPNFYVSYEGDNAAPLTAETKFKLALRVSYDPITIAGIGVLAGINQAADTPDYRQGLKGYGERFGATAADGFTDIMIGGAILPSLLHQDPRYFYQGTGTTRSRLRHALLAPFICKGDDGRWQPNYSTVGGDLASAGISNLYYPRSDRGTGLVFSTLAINTAERLVSTLAQEFVLGKFTHRDVR
ncbi:MAG: carboxypeptidase-like regulatory domain-containing protein [Candidatus Acidiferrales bacterium]